jgi:hypothetical protein
VLIFVKQNNLKTEKMENLNDILESKEFNEMFNFDNEIEELKKDGWELNEVLNFAKSLNK